MWSEKFKIIWNGIVSSFWSSIMLAFLFYLLSFVDIIPKFERIDKKMDRVISKSDSLFKAVSKLNENYFTKDFHGMPVDIGVNSELDKNTVSVFTDNKLNLKYGDIIMISNSINEYCPTIKLVVSKEIERPSNDKSLAEIFISKEAALLLGFDKYKTVGLLKVRLKKLDKGL